MREVARCIAPKRKPRRGVIGGADRGPREWGFAGVRAPMYSECYTIAWCAVQQNLYRAGARSQPLGRRRFDLRNRTPGSTKLGGNVPDLFSAGLPPAEFAKALKERINARLSVEGRTAPILVKQLHGADRRDD
jgi:hypothetical protein